MPNIERRTTIPATTKKAVYEDAYVPRSKPARYKCAICNEPFAKSDVQVDHIKPWADGGTHERGNLRILCSDGSRSCHRTVTRKQARNRQRAPQTRAQKIGRWSLATVVVLLAAAILYGVTYLSGDTQALASLTRAYKWSAALAVALGALILLGARLAAKAREPAPVETVTSEVQRVEAWIEKAVPGSKVKVESSTLNAPTITVNYPSSTPTNDNWRTELQEKAEDLYPKANIRVDWQTGKDRFIIRDVPDPLNANVPLLSLEEIERNGDYCTVDMGLTDNGQRWRLPVMGSHTLLAGATGSGKSASGLWNIIRGLAPGIRDGLVEIHAIDPKGGVELFPGIPLFKSFSDGEDVLGAELTLLDPRGTEPTQMDAHLSVLNEAVHSLRDRLKMMKADGIRKVEKPSRKYPLTLIVIDEAAFVLAYAADPKAKKAAQNALEVLTSQGRAAGYSVICLVQDPSSDVVKIRNLLPVRLALRLDTPVEVRMVLGDGARAAGARADKISRSMPGTGYMLSDKDSRPLRFRAPFVDNHEVERIVRDYAPRQVTLTK